MGVESAAFLEHDGDAFVAVLAIDQAPLTPEARARLAKWDLPYAAPFLVYGRCRAIVLLGRPIREHLADDTWHFMGILINQAAVAYENTCRFEAESERTLGLVHSLITMIEENTMSRGNTEAIVHYVQAVGTAMRSCRAGSCKRRRSQPG